MLRITGFPSGLISLLSSLNRSNSSCTKLRDKYVDLKLRSREEEAEYKLESYLKSDKGVQPEVRRTKEAERVDTNKSGVLEK